MALNLAWIPLRSSKIHPLFLHILPQSDHQAWRIRTAASQRSKLSESARFQVSVEQARLQANRGRPAFGQRVGIFCFSFFLQVIEDLLDHYRVFDAGNDFNEATALNVGFEYSAVIR